ncbi:MAG: threonine aldolase family protein [Candidatus Kariarchaeaceae archaeon]|jgi:threonine aldolase
MYEQSTAHIKIDLASDTKTRPSKAMKNYMMSVDVGDEQVGEDPTVNRMLKKTSSILGKEDALFLPTGTMCNMIAIKVHCNSGDEIIADKTAHIRNFETGGPAVHSGALIYPVEGKNGIFTPAQFLTAIRPESNYHPRTSLVQIEQTSNLGGGSIWPLEYIKEISDEARKRGIKVHMDGARLFNAVVESGISASEYAKFTDSVWIDFSKGLGGPMGGVLAGSHEFISKARRWKHLFGGAMRQAGIVAAAGEYALENNIEKLKIDHLNARIVSDYLNTVEGVELSPIQTNILFIDVEKLNVTAEKVNAELQKRGMRLSVSGKYKLRMVTHLDISRSQIDEAIEILSDILK